MAGTKTIVPGRGTATITVSDYSNIAADATITVNGIVLTNGVEWSNATGNNNTATSIASAISTATATTKCTGSATNAVVTISANTIGSAGNVSLNTSDAVKLLKSGTALTGGNSGIVGTSGAASVIYGVEVQAGANTCNIDVYNGTDATTGVLVLRLSCTASVSNNFEFLGGVILPNGCFIDITVTAIANPPTAVTVAYKQL